MSHLIKYILIATKKQNPNKKKPIKSIINTVKLSKLDQQDFEVA